MRSCELGSEPNVGGQMIALGNVISESLPKSARHRAPAEGLPLELNGFKVEYHRLFKWTDMILVQLNTSWSAEMFVPAGPDINVWNESQQMFSAVFFFFIISYIKWFQKESDSQKTGTSVLSNGGRGGGHLWYDKDPLWRWGAWTHLISKRSAP